MSEQPVLTNTMPSTSEPSHSGAKRWKLVPEVGLFPFFSRLFNGNGLPGAWRAPSVESDMTLSDQNTLSGLTANICSDKGLFCCGTML